MLSYQQLIQNAGQDWHNYTHHPFVLQLADGSLPAQNFIHYLKQDYLYLFHYSRAFALAGYKAQSFVDIAQACAITQSILDEVELHISYCQSWGIDRDELLNLPESPACIAYTRFVLDCGMTGTLAELYAAIAPCALGYAEIGKMIAASGLSPVGNPYQAWIDSYAGDEFQDSVMSIAHTLERLCQHLTPAQQTRIQEIFNTATRMEIAFWQMGLDLS